MLKLLVAVALLVANVHTLAEDDAKAVFARAASKHDAEVVGACQAVFDVNRTLLRMSSQAMQRLEADPGPKVKKDLEELFNNMVPNINNFDRLLDVELDRTAAKAGLSREQMLTWKLLARKEQKLKLERFMARLDQEPMENKAALDTAYALMPVVLKCVSWYFDQKKAADI